MERGRKKRIQQVVKSGKTTLDHRTRMSKSTHRKAQGPDEQQVWWKHKRGWNASEQRL